MSFALPPPERPAPLELDDQPPTETVQPAADANELVFTPNMAPPPHQEELRTWPKAKLSASFPRSQDVVFQAAVQAVRSCKCDVASIDRANFHLRFSIDPGDGKASAHDLFAFDMAGAAEVDLSSQDPNVNYQFDGFYQAIIREMGKYLMFAADPGRSEPPPPPPPPALPSRDRYDDRWDDRPYRRRRRREGVDGISIAGFVCGVVGIVLFCFPYIGGPLGALGIVFGSIGLIKRKNGFAVAALTCGIIACALTLIFFLWIVATLEHRRY